MDAHTCTDRHETSQKGKQEGEEAACTLFLRLKTPRDPWLLSKHHRAKHQGSVLLPPPPRSARHFNGASSSPQNPAGLLTVITSASEYYCIAGFVSDYYYCCFDYYYNCFKITPRIRQQLVSRLFYQLHVRGCPFVRQVGLVFVVHPFLHDFFLPPVSTVHAIPAVSGSDAKPAGGKKREFGLVEEACFAAGKKGLCEWGGGGRRRPAIIFFCCS